MDRGTTNTQGDLIMRKFLVRGTLVAFVSAMGIFGSGGLQVDGFDVSVQGNTASAKYKHIGGDCHDLDIACEPNEQWGWGSN
jgi:hypothetical protein